MSADAGQDAQLRITVESPSGAVLPQLTRVYTATEIANMPIDVVAEDYRRYDGFDVPGPLTGVSIATLVRQIPVPPASVGLVTFSCPGLPGTSALSARFHDLDDPATSIDYPFRGDLPPVFAPYTTGSGAGLSHDFTFAVQTRSAGHTDPSVTDGQSGFADVNDPMSMTLRLTTTSITPTVTPSTTSVTTHGSVDFTAGTGPVDSSSGFTWTWDFFGATTVTTVPSVSHRFDAAGTYPVQVTATSDDGVYSGASSPVEIAVNDPAPVTPDPTVTPPPGPSAGTGGTDAPVDGPVSGNGRRVGGVPTSRAGGGAPGPSFVPRSPGGSGTAGARSTRPPEGYVTGFVLLGPSGATAPQDLAAAAARDDSAPAARAGVTVRHLAAWLTGALVVLALLALGAGSERRRPTRARRR